MKTVRSNRVPIPLTPAEDAQLREMAQNETRSVQAMAGIIYRMGLKAYADCTED